MHYLNLSPIIFIMALVPLSHVVLNSQLGYRIKPENTNVVADGRNEKILINHLLYMDDIKLYARSPQELQRLIEAVKNYSDKMQMKFGLDKCKIVHVRHGKLQTDGEDHELPNGDKIETLCNEKNVDKYLGILQLNEIKHNQMKTELQSEYRKRVRAILKTQLSGKNKIAAINSLAIPVIRYSGGVVSWTQTELKELDRGTRKLLTTYRGLAKRSDVDRLYIARRDGGRGLLSVEDTIRWEEIAITEYRKNNKQDIIHREAAEEINLRKKREESLRERKEKWIGKPLHGQYARQMKDGIDKDATFQWLTRGNLTIESEGFLCAAQEQAVHTRAIAKHIFKTAANDKCRVCGGASETVMHILAECPNIAQTEYLDRHNQVARYIHLRMLEIHGIQQTGNKWYRHEPDRVLETESVKILWDFNIYTDKKISARRPDIVILNKAQKTGFIVDINCPNDNNVLRNEIEKRIKYTDLKIELERIWEINFQVVPVVIGSLGAVSTKIGDFINTLGLHRSEVAQLQEIVILASCHILRKYLTQSGLHLEL